MNFRGVESETLKGDCSFSLIPRYLQNYFDTDSGLQLCLGVPTPFKNSFLNRSKHMTSQFCDSFYLKHKLETKMEPKHG